MSAETPTESLCMEVLSARARLGESLWTFDARHRKALESLAAKGLVNVTSGTIERTVRASLTDKGRSVYVYEDYVPPLVQRIKALDPEMLADEMDSQWGTDHVHRLAARRVVAAVRACLGGDA